jgi:hypothetical protein
VNVPIGFNGEPHGSHIQDYRTVTKGKRMYLYGAGEIPSLGYGTECSSLRWGKGNDIAAGERERVHEHTPEIG